MWRGTFALHPWGWQSDPASCPVCAVLACSPRASGDSSGFLPQSYKVFYKMCIVG